MNRAEQGAKRTDRDESPLSVQLERRTIKGELWTPENGRIRCLACGHRCLIAPGHRGVCRVRFNRDGELRVPYGYVAGVQSDPVEKKPFFHVLPGADALTFGMLGCDFHCGYCQNRVTSQALRNPAATALVQSATPRQLVDAAQRFGARLLVSSYNEPLITAEWAVAVFREAKPAGLLCAFVSNGNATPEALDYLKPWISAYKIDLKSFNDQRYRTLGGTLAAVCRGIELVLERGIWLEVVTLVVPGFNDDENELRAMARFLAGCNRDIPWHVTAFHPDYRMTSTHRTRVSQLIRAAEIGMEEGLRFVYVGNSPGRVGRWENTWCPSCSNLLVERTGYRIGRYHISGVGRCNGCGSAIPGLWPPPKPEAPDPVDRNSDEWRRGPHAVRLPSPDA